MFKTLLIIIFVINLTFGQKYLICKVKSGDKCYFESKKLKINQTVALASDHDESRDIDNKINEVHFTSCSIYAVPSEIFTTFEYVKKLYMNGQNVEEIRADTFLKAHSLIYLTLNSNKIKVLNAFTFNGATNLQEMFINENQLESIHMDAFVGLTNIKRMYMYNNKVKYLHERTFKTLPTIIRIECDRNSLEYIPKKLFQNNLNLETIDLDSNKLSSIPQKMFSHLTKLSTLKLSGNSCISKIYSDAKSQFSTIESDLEKCNSVCFDPEVKENVVIERLERIENLLLEISANISGLYLVNP
jgi:Leucine-rich repeat (LRR) protein